MPHVRRQFFPFLLAFAPLAVFGAEPSASVNPRFTGTPPMRVWHADDMGAATFDWRAQEMDTSAVNWRAVVHPRTGFVYVANNEGVFEFDGVRWRMIRLPRGRTALNVLVAADGHVWATGPGTVVVLEPGDPAAGERVGDLIARDISPRLPPAILASLHVAPPAAVERNPTGAPDSPLDSLADPNPPLLETPEGVYLSLRRFLVRFGPDGRVDSWPTPETTGLPWWSGGALHLSVQGRGIHRLENGRLQPIAIAGEAQVWDTVQRTDGSWLWLTAIGPWLVQGESATPLASAAARALLAGEKINDALALPDGGFAYATSRHGLVVLDREGEIVEILDVARGLPGDQVNGLSLDREGGLWLAMHHALVRVQYDSGIASHGVAQGLRGIPQELAVAGERVFVGLNEGLVRRDPASGLFKVVGGLRGAVNRAVLVGEDLLAAASGLWSIAPDGAAVLCSDPAQRWALSAGTTEPGSAYISGRFNLGFARRNPPGDAKPWSIAFRFHNMNFTGLDSILDEGTGFVWMVGYPDRIVRRLDVRAGVRADAPLTTFGVDNGLPTMEETDKVLLLPTGGALFVVRRQGGAWRWDEARARFEPEPRLLRDGAGPNSVRASATSGWLYYPLPTPVFRRVKVGAGGSLAIENYSVPALVGIAGDSLLPVEAQHTLWLTSATGVVSFDFERKSHRPDTPPAASLRRVSTTEGAPLWAAPPFVASPSAVALTLSPSQRGVRIEFTLPSFEIDLLGRGKLQFRSRASGLDQDWTPWSTESHRDLTNLPDGAFEFEVQARDALDRTSAASRLEFHVLPPWWRTTTARAGWGALGLAFVTGLVWARTRTLRQRNVQLEAVVALRTAELARLRQIDRDESAAAKLAEEKASLELLRYQLNPHFLFNALNAFPGLVAEQPAAASRMAISLGEFCRRMLTQRGEEKQRVREEFAMLEAYLAVEKIRWGDSLEIEIRADPVALEAEIPAFLLLPLVENAIKHGGATTPGVLRIRLLAERDREALRFEVANSGLFSHEPAAGVASTSIGLENLHLRLVRYYPGTHTFSIGQEGDWVVARLSLANPSVPEAGRFGGNESRSPSPSL